MSNIDTNPYAEEIYVFYRLNGVVVLCTNSHLIDSQMAFLVNFHHQFHECFFLSPTLNWDIPPLAALARKSRSAPHFQK